MVRKGGARAEAMQRTRTLNWSGQGSLMARAVQARTEQALMLMLTMLLCRPLLASFAILRNIFSLKLVKICVYYGF